MTWLSRFIPQRQICRDVKAAQERHRAALRRLLEVLELVKQGAQPKPVQEPPPHPSRRSRHQRPQLVQIR